MKTPQLKHGVYDIATGEEITTPLGLPRSPATVLADMTILERLEDINQWYEKEPYWFMADDHRIFKKGHALEKEKLELTEKLREIEGGEAL